MEPENSISKAKGLAQLMEAAVIKAENKQPVLEIPKIPEKPKPSRFILPANI